MISAPVECEGAAAVGGVEVTELLVAGGDVASELGAVGVLEKVGFVERGEGWPVADLPSGLGLVEGCFGVGSGVRR